ncbi:hypothetical protein [Halorussus salinisoli]|uniref:hypothetical protein n=1 Tax=Halorussus salinisoli TaxID=2558242 RepID=UPI0010C18FE7|nr:hypothetical protein [Halorussus salinisoli]
MSRSSDSRSRWREDDADVVYEIATPFVSGDAKILLVEVGDDEIEVVVGDVPTPFGHDIDQNYPDTLDDEETMRAHAAAKWIVTETTKMFDDYEWDTSHYKTNNPNYHLRDVYFTCSRNEVDDAVLTAKKFVDTLEEKTLQHAEEFGRSGIRKPSEEL